MRYLSLFSGIEGATVAWEPLGWECAAVAEVDPFACRVLAHHYPDVRNLGDITKITEEQIKALGHIDIVVGGFPCQDLSVAGKRKGMIDEQGKVTRSGLFFDAMRIVRWSGARYVLLENVPGIYSSHKGRDFAALVREMLGVEFAVPPDGWQNSGIAISERGAFEWTTLDAQYWNLAQRRVRMFALGDFGDWRHRTPILFEPESLYGHPPPSRKKGQKTAPTTGTGAPVSSGEVTTARMVAFGEYIDDDTASAMKARDHKDATDLVAYPIQDQATRHSGKRGDKQDGKGNGLGIGEDGDPAPTMTKGDRHAVAYHEKTSMAVRRLTPTEAEILQGFPPGYTNIKPNGKPTPDGPRYKALGNSFAVPVVRWIGERIQKVSEIA